MQCLLLRVDLPSTEDSSHSSGTELGGKNFQVPLTPEMLHPMAKASTPGPSLQRLPFAPCSEKLDFSPPICYSNPSTLQGELLQGSASLSQIFPSAIGGFTCTHVSWTISSDHCCTSRFLTSFTFGAGFLPYVGTCCLMNGDPWRPQSQSHPINITLLLFFYFEEADTMGN